jgi:F420-non-reducing hydrogenase iron-sulfur subunit
MSEATEAVQQKEQGPATDFVPAIAVFHCRWCQPSSDQVRDMMPPEVAERAVIGRLNCSARMEAELAIKAFGEGYDGVLVIGCEFGECHYRVGNVQASRRLDLLRRICALAGIYPERLGALWVNPFDEDTTRRWIERYIGRLKKVGPFKDRD